MKGGSAGYCNTFGIVWYCIVSVQHAALFVKHIYFVYNISNFTISCFQIDYFTYNKQQHCRLIYFKAWTDWPSRAFLCFRINGEIANQWKQRTSWEKKSYGKILKQYLSILALAKKLKLGQKWVFYLGNNPKNASNIVAKGLQTAVGTTERYGEERAT